MSNLSSEEVEEESIPGAWKEDKTGSHDDLDMGSPSSGRTTDAPPHAPESSGSASTNKRRRVTRACDECRRKKIKCDGKQPCTHCTVYSYDCTYDQPSHRRRNPAPQYIEALEQRLHRAEAILRTFLPNLDIDDPSLDAVIQQNTLPSQGQPPSISTPANRRSSTVHRPQGPRRNQSDPDLESMVRATGHLDIDERGHWDYHGHSSGLSFIRRMREQFGDIPGPEQAGNALWQQQRRSSQIVDDPKLPESFHESTYEQPQTATDDLPSRDRARELCCHALDDATCILIFVHQPSFYKSFDRIYDISTDDYENQDHRFLPLLYVVLALGCLFAKDEQSDLERKGYKSATDEGYKYFWAARQLMDITDCRDLTSLQAIVFMILFLQCSAKLSTCYSYIGVALRSAMRMGLHRSFKDSFQPIEAETRKRVFWVIRKMDIFVGAMLGLPQTLSDDDVDQDFPTETDDIYITDTGITRMPSGETALVAASNANFRLIKVVSKIIRRIYPIKGFQNKEQSPSKAYSVSYATIREIENDLQGWMEDLPTVFKPGGEEAPTHFLRIQQLLRMSYAHTQMMLYRPFLHYVASKMQSRLTNQRSYACAAACVSVSRNIIHITSEMQRRGLLVGSYWFIMYTTFFAILSLVFFALENPASATSEDVMRDAKEGKETLAKLAKRSMAADRCTATLTVLFDKLAQSLDQSVKSEASRIRETLSQSMRSSSASRTIADRSRAEESTQAKRSTQRAPETLQRTNIAPPPPLDPRMYRNFPQQQQRPALPPSGFYPSSMSSDPSSTTSSTPQQPQHQQRRPVQQQQQQQQQQQDQQNQRQQQQEQRPYVQPQLQNVLYSGNIPDLSPMMFPSNDPFAYPKQPMTTLENTWSYHQNNPYPRPFDRQNMFASTFNNAPGAARSDDQMDVRLLGPLPPYMMQSHNQGGGGTDIGGFGSPQMMGEMHEQGQGVPTSGAEMWNQQARTHGLPGMNLDDIFEGEDWRESFTDRDASRHP